MSPVVEEMGQIPPPMGRDPHALIISYGISHDLSHQSILHDPFRILLYMVRGGWVSPPRGPPWATS